MSPPVDGAGDKQAGLDEFKTIEKILARGMVVDAVLAKSAHGTCYNVAAMLCVLQRNSTLRTVEEGRAPSLLWPFAVVWVGLCRLESTEPSSSTAAAPSAEQLGIIE